MSIALPAAAQFGPGNLPEPIEVPEQPEPRQTEPAPPANDPLSRPAFIKPGAQLTYYAQTSNLGGPFARAEEGVKLIEYTVVASTPERVYLGAATYLPSLKLSYDDSGRPDTSADPKAQLDSVLYTNVTASKVDSGEALWMAPAALRAMLVEAGGDSPDSDAGDAGEDAVLEDPENGAPQPAGPDRQVQSLRVPYLNEEAEAIRITEMSEDFARVDLFHAGHGLKLSHRLSQGAMRDGVEPGPFARRNQYRYTLLSQGQIDCPVIGQDFPEWTANLAAMTYMGKRTTARPGTAETSTDMQMQVDFESIENNLALGTTSIKDLGGEPAVNTLAIGPGSIMSFWVNTEALKQMQPGTVHRNPTTRTTITYEVQEGHLGKLGVFVLINDAQTFWTVAGYNLNDGRLIYSQFGLPQLHTTIEFELQSIQQR